MEATRSWIGRRLEHGPDGDVGLVVDARLDEGQVVLTVARARQDPVEVAVGVHERLPFVAARHRKATWSLAA